MTQDVAAVAAKLTKAQRRVVHAMSEKWQRPGDIPAAGSTLMALWDFGRDYSTTATAIATPVMLVHRDAWDEPLCHVWQLSDLGIAVRDHLLKEAGR